MPYPLGHLSSVFLCNRVHIICCARSISILCLVRRSACPSHCAPHCLPRSVLVSSCPSRPVPVCRRLIGPDSFGETKMRRKQRCEENRDAKRTDRERERERGERGEVAARSAAPAGARTNSRCCPPGGGGVVIPFSFGGVTLPWANSSSDCASPGLFWAYFEIAQK